MELDRVGVAELKVEHLIALVEQAVGVHAGLANLFYVFNLGPVPGWDLTLLGFALTGILLMWVSSGIGLALGQPNVSRNALWWPVVNVPGFDSLERG